MANLDPKKLADKLDRDISYYTEGFECFYFKFKQKLDPSLISESKYIFNLCRATGCHYDLVEDLENTLINSQKKSLKPSLEAVFKRHLKDLSLSKEFFSRWDHLDDNALRYIVTNIIRNLNQKQELALEGQVLITNSTDVSDLNQKLFQEAGNFAPQSFMAELLQNKSLPWLFTRMLSKQIGFADFAEQSETWYNAYHFAEQLSSTRGGSDLLRLLASRANSGQIGTSPAQLPGSGVHNSHRLYVAGDDPRYIDWSLSARTDKLYIKTHIDDIHLKQKEYIIDLESLTCDEETRERNSRIAPKIRQQKIENLLIELCNNFRKGNNQNLQIRYKSALILKLDKRRLAHMFQQGINSHMHDRYGNRNVFIDFYITLNLLGFLAENYSAPFDKMLAPVISGTDWQPETRSQIILSAANAESILHPECMAQIQQWSRKGSEVMEIRLDPTNTTKSSRAGLLASV